MQLALRFDAAAPRYPTAHKSPVDGRWINCKVCKLFFNAFGVPQRVWNKMSECDRDRYRNK